MKKKVAILGSTGSIGKTSLNILRKDSKKFEIVLLSANSNYPLIKKQIKKDLSIFPLKMSIWVRTGQYI